ncbi:hypothetical protein L1887_00805 [Cichorium endivia]|nr:hypothetical protein L1887_00805 [Cichorium endivia]
MTANGGYSGIGLSAETTLGDDEAFSMKYVGGLKVCKRFRSASDVNSFMSIKDDWFSEFSRANHAQCHFDRVAWLKILGLPIKLWDRRNFDRIAGKFGSILVPFDASTDARDLSHGRICVLTDARRRIDEEVLIEFDGHLLNVYVVEYKDGWFPLKSPEHVADDEQFEHDDYSEEDSDGISDTMMHEDSSDEYKESEIIADDVDKVEDSFAPDNAGAGDVRLEQETVKVNDDSNPVINDAYGKKDNYHGEPHQPLGELSSGGKYDSDKRNNNDRDNLNNSDNISFGELKILVPNGCFGPFNQNWAVSPPAGPNGVILMGRVSTNNEGGVDSLGPELNFTATSHLNPDVDATPEIVRTVRIGRAIGFDIDVDNDILIDAMGETGVQNVAR